jgi:hypothetical protein
MCKANGKRVDHWKELKATQAYIQELQANYPESRVVYSDEGVNGGTWGHPSLAINLARWISPAFAVWCDAHIFNLMTSGSTSLDIDPIEEMKLKIELAKIERDKAELDNRSLNLRYTIVNTCPESVQQRILGYQVIKETEIVETVIDRSSGESSTGVGITYIARRLGFKSTAQCWKFLDSIGYGKDSGYWKDELIAQHSPKLSRDDLYAIEQHYPDAQRQLFLGE